jgi:hypothetical protein
MLTDFTLSIKLSVSYLVQEHLVIASLSEDDEAISTYFQQAYRLLRHPPIEGLLTMT